MIVCSFNTGDLIIITNMVLWAIYCACLRLRPDVHPLSFLFALSIVALIGNVPFALWEHASGYHLVADTKTALAILYAAVFTTLLAYITWNRGIDLIGAPRAGAFLHTIPLFSTTLAMVFLGEQLKLFHVVGFILILSGVSLAARPSAAARSGTAARRQRRVVGQERWAGGQRGERRGRTEWEARGGGRTFYGRSCSARLTALAVTATARCSCSRRSRIRISARRKQSRSYSSLMRCDNARFGSACATALSDTPEMGVAGKRGASEAPAASMAADACLSAGGRKSPPCVSGPAASAVQPGSGSGRSKACFGKGIRAGSG